MTTFTKELLTGSTDGKMINITATTTPGNILHTAHAISLDEIWLWVQNNHTLNVTLTIEWGGTSSPNDLIQVIIPPSEGLYHVVPGILLTNSQIVRAFASVTGVLSIAGFVNRIT